MISILILEDNPKKAGKVTAIIDQLGSCKYDVASDLVTARKYLQKSYDLLILDMNLPERFSELPKENSGIKFIDEIRKSKRVRLPKHIIGLTEFPLLHKKFEKEFSDKALSLVRYDNKGNEWQQILIEKIEFIKQSSAHKSGDTTYLCDVAIITALRDPELQAILDLNYSWTSFKVANDSSTYFEGKLKVPEKTLRLIAVNLPQMGMVAAATTATKLITTFRPRYVIMPGICGGIKGKVNLGDIVIADLSFDFGSGKVKKTENDIEIFEPDFKSIPLYSELKEDLVELSTKKDVLRQFKDSWKGNKLANELSLRIGPVGSGAAVIANSNYTERIVTHQRKLIAIDMETYSIFYCCQYANSPKPLALSIKTVCDYADHDKNDDIQQYCSFVSSQCVDYIIQHILRYEDSY